MMQSLGKELSSANKHLTTTTTSVKDGGRLENRFATSELPVAHESLFRRKRESLSQLRPSDRSNVSPMGQKQLAKIVIDNGSNGVNGQTSRGGGAAGVLPESFIQSPPELRFVPTERASKLGSSAKNRHRTLDTSSFGQQQTRDSGGGGVGSRLSRRGNIPGQSTHIQMNAQGILASHEQLTRTQGSGMAPTAEIAAAIFWSQQHGKESLSSSHHEALGTPGFTSPIGGKNITGMLPSPQQLVQQQKFPQTTKQIIGKGSSLLRPASRFEDIQVGNKMITSQGASVGGGTTRGPPPNIKVGMLRKNSDDDDELGNSRTNNVRLPPPTTPVKTEASHHETSTGDCVEKGSYRESSRHGKISQQMRNRQNDQDLASTVAQSSRKVPFQTIESQQLLDHRRKSAKNDGIRTKQSSRHQDHLPLVKDEFVAFGTKTPSLKAKYYEADYSNSYSKSKDRRQQTIQLPGMVSAEIKRSKVVEVISPYREQQQAAFKTEQSAQASVKHKISRSHSGDGGNGHGHGQHQNDKNNEQMPREPREQREAASLSKKEKKEHHYQRQRSRQLTQQESSTLQQPQQQQTGDRGESKKQRQQRKREMAAAKAELLKKVASGDDHHLDKTRSRRRRHARHASLTGIAESSTGDLGTHDAMDTTETSQKRRKLVLKRKQIYLKKATSNNVTSQSESEKQSSRHRDRRRRRSTTIDDQITITPEKEKMAVEALAEIKERNNEYIQGTPGQTSIGTTPDIKDVKKLSLLQDCIAPSVQQSSLVHSDGHQQLESITKDHPISPLASYNAEKPSLQQEKDLKILQKCFNRSLERIQQDYEGSPFFAQRGGDCQTAAQSQRVTNLWISPRLGPQQVQQQPADLLQSSMVATPRQCSIDDDKFVVQPVVMSSMGGQPAISNKPRTSFGQSREHMRTPGAPHHKFNDDFSKSVNRLRESLHTSQKASRRSYATSQQQQQQQQQQVMQQNQTPSQSKEISSVYSRHSGTVMNSPHYAQNFLSQKQMQQMIAKGGVGDNNPQSSTLNRSIQSPAKQHQFRKELKLPIEREKHQLILIESAATKADPGCISGEAQNFSREITLKAVKMSSQANEKSEMIKSEPAACQSSEEQQKLKIITTQIPQSLLICNNSKNLGDARQGGGGPQQQEDETFRYFMRQTTMPVNQRGVKPGTVKQAASIIQGYLVPSNNGVVGGGPDSKGQSHLKQSSMPPSLTAINVQSMARDFNLTSTVFGTTKPTSVALPPRQRVTKKKQNSTIDSSSQQVKLARRQIQFYQKRQAEKNMAAKTPKNAFVTRRLLFKRRARLQDQNLLIFYFDGVIGELCSRTSSFGCFKVRHGTFTGLRKLFQQHQIAIFIPYVKNRAKVISCYIEKFQGCPVDAIYCVQTQFFRDHSDMRFVDYSQIYEDFDLVPGEKLIDKCMIIAPRTKEVSQTLLQPHSPSETVQQSVRMSQEKNEAEENQEEQRLMQTYLMNRELEMTNRVEVFQVLGCPANLSAQLEPLKKKTNYLQSNEESMPVSPMRKDSLQASKTADKLTATQANRIAVDLGQQYKPVTLLVPHTKNQCQQMYSFQPILKIIEALAVLDEHSKASNGSALLTTGGPRDSVESTTQAAASMGKTIVTSTMGGQAQIQGQCVHSCLASQKAHLISNSKEDKELEPYSTVDSFYAFKTMLVGTNCCIQSSLQKRLFAVETKKVQTFLYRDQMLGRVLLEKAEIKKCYQFTQQKHANADRSAPTQSSYYIQIKAQNEYVKRYIQDYTQVYFRNVKEQMDEAKVMRMTAYFMNQFSQRLVDNKEKKPNQLLREMFHKEINYKTDLPSRNINLFKNHRFLILVKRSSASTGFDMLKDDNSVKQATMETVDMQKIMGSSYFRQLESFRQGSGQKQPTVPEILPASIVRILYKQRPTDCTDWFTKKAFSKPIQLLEKQQMVLERKELMNRGEQEKSSNIGSGGGFTSGGNLASARNQDLQTLPSFHRGGTNDVARAGSTDQQLNFLSKRNRSHNTTATGKTQRPLASRGKTLMLD